MRLLLYPLQIPALITILFCSFLLASPLMFFFAVKNEISEDFHILFMLGMFPVIATALLMLFNYALLVLEASMYGEENAPVITGKQASFENKQFYRLAIFLVFFVYGAELAREYVGLLLAMPIIFVGAFLFPAYLINVVRLESIVKAVQWQEILMVFRSLRGMYLVISVLFYSCFFLVYLYIESGLDSFINVFVVAYLLILTFHLVGKFITEYSIEVHLPEPETRAVVKTKKVSAKQQARMDEELDAKRIDEISTEIYRMCRGREFANAFRYLEAELEKENWKYDDIFYDKFKDSFYGEFSMAHARAYINRLIANKKMAKAWMVCELNLKNREGFMLKESQAILALSQVSLSIEQQVLFKTLVERFIKSFPDDAQIENLRFLIEPD